MSTVRSFPGRCVVEAAINYMYRMVSLPPPLIIWFESNESYEANPELMDWEMPDVAISDWMKGHFNAVSQLENTTLCSPEDNAKRLSLSLDFYLACATITKSLSRFSVRRKVCFILPTKNYLETFNKLEKLYYQEAV
jgi:hypothetical protein